MRPSFSIKSLIAALLAAVPSAFAENEIISSVDDYDLISTSSGYVTFEGDLVLTPGAPESWEEGTYLFNDQIKDVRGAGDNTLGVGTLVIDAQNMDVGLVKVVQPWITTSFGGTTLTGSFYFDWFDQFIVQNFGDADGERDSGSVFGINNTTSASEFYIARNNRAVITNNIRTISDAQNTANTGFITTSNATFTGNGRVEVSDNATVSTKGIVYGGVFHTQKINSYSGNVKKQGAGQFCLNAATAKDSSYEDGIVVCNNGIVLQDYEKGCKAKGGFVYAEGGAQIQTNKFAVDITGNYIRLEGDSSSAASAELAGGAFYVGYFVIKSNTAKLTISGNGIDAGDASGEMRGGAFCIENCTNFTDYGIQMQSNTGAIEFSYNYLRGENAIAKGAAIYCFTNSTSSSNGLKISNNDHVTFRGNYEATGGDTLLRSVYADLRYSNFEWSAKDGGSIDVYDSITLTNSGSSEKVINLNKYGSKYQTGTLLFSGEHTEADLAAAKGGVAGTAAEIKESRTSRIEHMSVNMQSGTLKIEKGAALVIDSTAANTFSTMELVLDMGDLVMTGGATFTDVVMNVGATGVSHLMGVEAAGAAPATGYGLVLSGATGPMLTVAGESGLTINFDMTGVAAGDPALLSIQDLGLAAGSKPVTVNLLNCDSIADGATYNLVDIASAGDGWLDALNTNNVLFTFDGVENAELAKNFQNENGGYMLSYEAPVKEGGNTGGGNVPEPGTATLSLLALAGLLARRRRRGCQKMEN